MNSIAKIAISVLIGFALSELGEMTGSTFLYDYLKNNMTMIVICVLTINTATLSITLAKVRDILDKLGKTEGFEKTAASAKFSIVEQIVILGLSLILLVLREGSLLAGNAFWLGATEVVLIASFAYLVSILYDTARSIFIILELK